MKLKIILNIAVFISGALLFNPFAIAEVGDYGKYCGGDNTSKEKPIDAVDYICMLHDQCIDKNNTNCQCDYDFNRRMNKIAIGRLGPAVLRDIFGTLTIPTNIVTTVISDPGATYAAAAGPAVMVGHKCNCYYKKSTSCWGHKKAEVPCIKYKDKIPYPTLCEKKVPYPTICHDKTHESTFDATACSALQVLPGNSHIVGPYRD